MQLTRLNRKAERESDFVDFKGCGEQIDLRRSLLASWITTVGFDRKAEWRRREETPIWKGVMGKQSFLSRWHQLPGPVAPHPPLPCHWPRHCHCHRAAIGSPRRKWANGKKGEKSCCWRISSSQFLLRDSLTYTTTEHLSYIKKRKMPIINNVPVRVGWANLTDLSKLGGLYIVLNWR